VSPEPAATTANNSTAPRRFMDRSLQGEEREARGAPYVSDRTSDVTITVGSITTKYLRVLLKLGHGPTDNMRTEGGDHIASDPTPD
jgi:hypothetical protein